MVAPQYTLKERRQIHRKAKRLLGIKQYDATDRYIFMSQCMQDMMDSGEAEGVSDARDVCELLWSEQEDLWGED